MAKPNYNFEKRQRDIAKKKQQDEKRAKKQQRNEAKKGDATDDESPNPESGAITPAQVS